MAIAPIKEDDSFNSDEFYARMKDYLALTQVDFNNPEKAKQDLGQLVAEDENFISSSSYNEVMNLRNALLGESEGRLFKYTQKNFADVSKNLDESQLISMIFQMPSKKGVSGGNDDVIKAVEKYHKEEKESQEDPQKYIFNELQKVHADFRDIVARYGASAIIKTSLDSLQAKVFGYFAKEDEFDKDKATDFIKSYMNYYSASNDDKEKINGAMIGMGVARAAYESISTEKAEQEHAKKLYEDASEKKKSQKKGKSKR